MRENKFIHYIKNRYDRYDYVESNSAELCVLSDYLFDAWDDVAQYRELILDPTISMTGSNSTLIDKEDDYIIISDQYPALPGKDYPFKIKQDEFVRLLDEWEKVGKQKPQEILITYDGQRFEIKTK